MAGIGLHSGLPSSVRVLPSSNHGILFRNRSTGQEIPAVCANVSDTQRCTMLRAGEAHVQTVEHILSALAGLGVTDAVVEFEGIELPALDGSALPYVEALREVGLRAGQSTLEPLTIAEPVTLSRGQSVVTAVPSDSLWISVTLDYPALPSMRGLAATWHGESYGDHIAPARTFGFVGELDALLAHGLGKGVSAENVVALAGDGTVDPRTPLRFENELARHKLLDMIGDLSLTGRPVVAGIVAFRPSHAINTALASKLHAIAGA